LAACLVGLFAADARADHGKIDLVELSNGNQIVCEVRNLERGMLTAKTDAMGTVSIQWGKVLRVVSPAQFEVELSSGRFLFGAIASPAVNRLTVRTAVGEESVDLSDVVRLSPIENGFWKKLDGSMDLGFSFAQAESLTQWSFNSTVRRRRPQYLNQVTFSSQETIDASSTRVSRNNATYQFQASLGNRWFLVPQAQFSQNEQLGLDLRSVLSGGIGRYVIQSNRTLLSVMGGATYTREQFKEESGTDRSEAVGRFTWEWFTFGDGETNFINDLEVYQNLGAEARTRLELVTSFRRKFFKDLYWSINLLESFDSAPPENQKKNDASIAISLGWSF
jgi:putative salt-induced outer membrane protein YdiY